MPIAYVVFVPGRHATEEDLKSFLGGQIAAFKIPVHILPADQLPLTHSGKIDHAALARRYASTAVG